MKFDTGVVYKNTLLTDNHASPCLRVFEMLSSVRWLFLSVILTSCTYLGSSSSPSPTAESRFNEAVDSLVQQLTQEPALFDDKKLAVTDLTDASGQKTRLTA